MADAAVCLLVGKWVLLVVAPRLLSSCRMLLADGTSVLIGLNGSFSVLSEPRTAFDLTYFVDGNGF